MGYGRPCLSALIVSVLASGTALRSNEVIAESPADQSLHDPVALTTSQDLLVAERVRAIRSSIDGRSNPALATIQTGHLLGAAMAHEVGHALGLPHGSRGVMKGQYTLDEALALRTSRLVFTSAESASMRSALRAATNSVATAAR